MRKKKFQTVSGIPLESSYGGPEVPRAGEYPYTRGVHREMYRERLWTMRQYAGFGTAEEANKRYRYLLDQGSTGLSVAFDLPTQMGLDADDERALGEVGKVGVSICTLDDMERLLEGIPLEEVSVSMTINATASILLAMYLVVAERRGISWKLLRGTIQNDILKEYLARGTYIYPAKGSLRLITDSFAFCKEHVSKWNPISISGYHIREAGSTAVEELGLTFANAICYVESAIASGLAVDDIAPQLSFFFNCHNELIEEVAKFRAARKLWATIMKERFQAKNARSLMLRFHTQTAGSSLTAQQPLNNIVRTTIQALAAVIGGTQSLHTNSYDEALGLPTEESARLALRTQQIIAEESGLADVVDVFGGSYVVEALTNTLIRRASDVIASIDDVGGMVQALDHAIPQQMIERSAYQYQRDVESGERALVGVNRHLDRDEDSIPEVFQASARGESEQRERLTRFRGQRKAAGAQSALSALQASAEAEGNTLGAIVDCVRAGATLGEVSSVLRGVFGEYQERF